MWYRKTGKVGNSMKIGIPGRLCKMLELLGGETMLISLENNKIVIEKDDRIERMAMAKKKIKTRK